ncbi:MAG: hypothetical protein WCJ96_00680 [Verrucomicrobiota bacterium]|jgi:hypothetical protein
MRLIRPLLFCAAAVFAAELSAQQALDAKTQQQYERLLRHKYSRDLSEVFAAMEKSARLQDSASADVRFLYAFRLGDWATVRAELAKLPPDLGRGIYDKMVSDLAERPKSGLRLEDVFALSDAAPGELTDLELRKFGQMLGQVVPPSESFWVAERLKHGTEHLGGKDPAHRLAAGRVLLSGGFKELARTYLPDEANLEKIADEGLRAEVAAFLAGEQATELAQRDQITRIWDDNLKILRQDRVNDWEKSKAATALIRVLTQVPSTALAASFEDLLRTQPDAAMKLVAGLSRKLQSESRNDPVLRIENLRAQTVLAGLIANHPDGATGNWAQVLTLMAESWMSEAEASFSQHAGGGRQRIRSTGNEVDPEELLNLAPAGKWLAALPASLRNRFDASLSRAIIASANFELAADHIVDISRRHPEAGLALAEDFLQAWGQAHNPQLPEDLRRRYGLPEDARIPITPVMMERNIESLARMMEVFRKAGVAPRDQSKVVTAFDLAYSNAEAYRDSHLEKVFGPTAKMDEQLFFLLTQKMHANLVDRWRRVDLQRSSLTRRNEAQTYAMVEAGYASVLKMIDDWSAGRPQAYKALTLGGVVLNDWADFESFQDLSVAEPAKRLVAAKERMLQSQDYFQRAADSYGKSVVRLQPSEYTIDGYLSWFHAVVGVGANGQVNLSKPMNRAALGRIRAAILALPGKSAGIHMGQVAKTLNARLTDTNNPLHEDIKYRYLASALVVTKDDPFTLGLKKRSDYLDELLSEIRVQTRVDGPNTVGASQEFGIVISVLHTEAMGRVARFGQYLSNDTGAVAASTKRRGNQARKSADVKGPRDEFEQSLTDTLSPFFNIRSMTFATPDVKPRPTNRAGWEETVLAYVLVRAKDASIDKIPPVQMELRFIDLSGPVTIPATSAETLLKVATTTVAPRPAEKIEVIQTLDTRQFAINGSLTLEVSATATGLIPELDELLDLAPLSNVVKIRQVTTIDPLMVKELITWADNVAPRTERRWAVTLDGDPIRAADKATDVPFPTIKAAHTTTVWRTYQDMDPVILPKASVLLDRVKVAAGAGYVPPNKMEGLWYQNTWFLLGGIGCAVALLSWLLLRKKNHGPRPLRARDVFKMPAAVDGFSVVALLRKLAASPLANLNTDQRRDLQQDIAKIEQGCFGEAMTLGPADLKSIAEKWLRNLR